jgi:hypothetical protein
MTSRFELRLDTFRGSESLGSGGKTATLQTGILFSFNAGSGQLLLVNGGGGVVTYSSWNMVPSSGSVSTAIRVAAPGSIANGAISGSVNEATLPAGALVSLNSNSTGSQLAWLSVVEY